MKSELKTDTTAGMFVFKVILPTKLLCSIVSICIHEIPSLSINVEHSFAGSEYRLAHFTGSTEYLPHLYAAFIVTKAQVPNTLQEAVFPQKSHSLS